MCSSNKRSHAVDNQVAKVTTDGKNIKFSVHSKVYRNFWHLFSLSQFFFLIILNLSLFSVYIPLQDTSLPQYASMYIFPQHQNMIPCLVSLKSYRMSTLKINQGQKMEREVRVLLHYIFLPLFKRKKTNKLLTSYDALLVCMCS